MKALREQGLLPRVIAGSSVGSIGEHCWQSPVLASPACIERVSAADTCTDALELSSSATVFAFAYECQKALVAF